MASKKSERFSIPLSDPDAPGLIEHWASKQRLRGDHEGAQESQDLADRVRAEQAESEKPEPVQDPEPADPAF